VKQGRDDPQPGYRYGVSGNEREAPRENGRRRTYPEREHSGSAANQAGYLYVVKLTNDCAKEHRDTVKHRADNRSAKRYRNRLVFSGDI
jgi:hypothetical protein